MPRVRIGYDDFRRSPRQPSADSPIIFYDGESGLCNHFVQFMLRNDPRSVVRFSPLQGETYQRVVQPLIGPPDMTTVMLWESGSVFTHSDAVLRATRRLGGILGIGSRLALYVPRAIRDVAYRIVARHRYRWFGKVDKCRIPQSNERFRFMP